MHYETIFYKIVQAETAHVVQDLIVTFQIKYRDYLRNVRNGQIERASGYSSAYVRDNLTDDLHERFDFRTDFEIVPYENFKKIFRQIKK